MKIEAGDYTFKLWIQAEESKFLCSTLQLGNYGVVITKNNVRIDSGKSNLYEDLGIAREEFLDLIVEGTKQVIAEKLQREIDKNSSTPIRSFVYLAGDDSIVAGTKFYGFTQHDIFKKISNKWHLLQSDGRVYVHTREVFPEFADEDDYYDYIAYDRGGYTVIGFDFDANTKRIEIICNKIKANQETDE